MLITNCNYKPDQLRLRVLLIRNDNFNWPKETAPGVSCLLTPWPNNTLVLDALVIPPVKIHLIDRLLGKFASGCYRWGVGRGERVIRGEMREGKGGVDGGEWSIESG